MINNSDLETINQIAEYRCRSYYENILGALVVISAGVIIGLSVSKTAPTTSSNTADNSNQSNVSADGKTAVKDLENIKAGTWVNPLKSMRLTSPFGMRMHPTLKYWKPHNGGDYSGRVGTPLYSINNGKVTRIRNDNTCGRGVDIAYPDGITSVYCHMDSVNVTAGQEVRSGQSVGTVGNTGRSTGPHLHWGIKKDGRWIDPEKFRKQVGL